MPPKRNSVLNRIKFWQKSADTHQETQKENPFRASFEKTAGPKRGDAEYGRAKRGSFTEVRAQQAQQWVNKEVDKLVEVISELGVEGDDGLLRVKFGPLFIAYQDISDTLVGILQRAKKRGRIQYPGEILFQGSHDSVDIVLVRTQEAEIEVSRNRKLSRRSCVWAESVMEQQGDRLEVEDEEDEPEEELRKSSLADLGERLSYVGEGLRFSDVSGEVDEEGNPLRKSAAAA